MKKQINKYNVLSKYPIKIWQRFACVQTSPISFIACNNVLEKKKAFFGEPKVPILQIYFIHLKITLSYINL